MAKKDNEEIPFSAGPGSGASEKLKALQAAMDKIEKNHRNLWPGVFR